MKILVKFTLIALIISHCCAELYQWNVRTVENQPQDVTRRGDAGSNTDFGDELKVQSALNNELQRDLLKISGKANENYNNNNDNVYYDNLRNYKYNVQNGKYTAAAVEKEVKRGQQNYRKDDQSMEKKLYNIYATISNDDNIEKQKYLHNFDGRSNDVSKNQNFGFPNIEFIPYYDNNKGLSYNNPHLKEEHHRQLPNSPNDLPNNYKDQNQLDGKYNKMEKATDTDLNFYQEKNLQNKDTIQVDTPNHRNQGSLEPTELLYNKKEDYNHTKFDNQQFEYSTEDHQKAGNKEKNKYAQIGNHCTAKIPNAQNFLGSNLFGNTAQKCFSAEDIKLLIIRRDFESLLPKDLPKSLLNDEMLALLMNYFHICHQIITTMTPESSKDLSQKAFFDTLGSYLNYYLVPVAKYSYYAGAARLESVENILKLHQQCERRLNTNGNGWREPMKDVLNELDMVYIKPLRLAESNVMKGETSCHHLDLNSEHNEADNDKMLVTLPKLQPEDNSGYLDNIWLPFRRKKVYNLKSSNSAFIVVKFYETLSECYQSERVPQVCYDREFKEWFMENIQIHLSDDTFYPGLGSVLRILESIRRRPRKKVKYTDNLWQTDYEDDGYVERGETRAKKSYSSGNDRKSKEFMEILQKSKHFQGNQPAAKHWLDKNYANDEEDYQDYFDGGNRQTINEKEKLQNNENKNKATENPEKYAKNENSRNDRENLTDSSAKEQTQFGSFQMTPLLMIIIISVPIIALISVIVICCLKLKKKKNKEVRLREYGEGKRRSKPDEETQLLNPHSKSVVHGNNNNNKSTNRVKNIHKKPNNSTAGSTASSSSSLMCQIPPKCCGIKRSGGPAIIETTSLDYSSSEVEDAKNIKKAQTKSVKIDEKSGKTNTKLNARDNGVTAKGNDKKSKDISKK